MEEVRLDSCSIAVPARTTRDDAALRLVLLSIDASTMSRHLPALWGIARKAQSAVQNLLTRLPPLRDRRWVVETGNGRVAAEDYPATQ